MKNLVLTLEQPVLEGDFQPRAGLYGLGGVG